VVVIYLSRTYIRVKQDPLKEEQHVVDIEAFEKCVYTFVIDERKFIDGRVVEEDILEGGFMAGKLEVDLLNSSRRSG
jgi:uncharacterized protein YacL